MATGSSTSKTTKKTAGLVKTQALKDSTVSRNELYDLFMSLASSCETDEFREQFGLKASSLLATFARTAAQTACPTCPPPDDPGPPDPPA